MKLNMGMAIIPLYIITSVAYILESNWLAFSINCILLVYSRRSSVTSSSKDIISIELSIDIQYVMLAVVMIYIVVYNFVRIFVLGG